MFKNRKNTGIALFCFGVLLIFCAAGLCGFNMYSIKKAETAAADIAVQFEKQLSYYTDEKSGISAEYGDFTPDYPTEIIINGNSYIGILSIPSLTLRLPVRSELSYGALTESPCRYSGSVSGDDLVIAAHNYPSHFGALGRLANGECVRFTDASGAVTEYVVIQTEILGPYEVERMTCGDYDLTLFTCTPGGRFRATVRCMKV